jgi:RNA polymerase sigma factor (sigma-70 family)
MTVFQNNQALLDAFRLGKKKALLVVYQYYRKDIERFVATGWVSQKTKSRIGAIGDYDLRADLIQEIFLRAFSKNARLSYDGLRDYKPYLLTLARNVILDYIQSRPNDAISHICVELDDLENLNLSQLTFFDNQANADETPEDTLYWHMCVKAMRAYVATLDEKYQQFVSLRFRQELPLLEVARRLNLTRGKARFMENELGRNLKTHLLALNLAPDSKKTGVQKNKCTKNTGAQPELKKSRYV